MADESVRELVIGNGIPSRAHFGTPTAIQYPECAKLASARNRHVAITEFMEWIDGQKLFLCESWPTGEGYDQTHRRHDNLIFDFLGIDQAKLETERRAMLDAAGEYGGHTL